MGWRASARIVILIGILIAGHSAPALDLTRQERAFIASHPTIVVGGEMDWPPFDFVEDGEYQGAANDYLSEIAALTGLKFDVVTGYTWTELLEMIRRREIDMLPMMYWSATRGREFNLTNPYITVRHYAFVLGDPVATRSLADLHGRTVAVPHGYASADRLARDHPQIRLLMVPTTLDALDSVVTGRADAVIEQLSGIAYHATNNGIVGLQPAFPVNLGVNDVHMAARGDWPLLRDILQKALDELPTETTTAIMARWTGSEDAASAFVPASTELTDVESAFLARRAGLIACVNASRLPYEGYRDNAVDGMSSDYLAHISTLLGMPVTPRPASGWPQIENDIAAGRCDFAAHAVYAAHDNPAIIYSQAYHSESLALATRAIEGFLPALGSLGEARIGVVVGYSDAQWLRAHYPQHDFIEFPTLNAGLAAVKNGKLFGLLDQAPVLNYAIQREFDGHLKISGKFSDIVAEFRVAVDATQPTLARIVDKALDATPQAQRQAFHDKWVAVTVERQGNDRLLRWALIGAGIIVVLVIVRTAAVQRRHREEIRAKNEELLRANRWLEQQNRDVLYQAHHDPLTGLSNRAKLLTDADRALRIANRSGTTIGMLFLDLDHFKQVNDTLGHDVGDRLLQAVAQILQEQLRESDTLYRLGGDEFVVLLECVTDAASCAIVARRIITSLARPVIVGEHALSIGASIGISTAPNDALTVDALLKHADSAMYVAKKSGRSTMMFYRDTLIDSAVRKQKSK